eukprot:1187595-Prorocentrum_minimum.AAC.2
MGRAERAVCCARTHCQHARTLSVCLEVKGASGHTCSCLNVPEAERDSCKDNDNPTWASPYMYAL